MLASGPENMTHKKNTNFFFNVEGKVGSRTAGDHNARIQTGLILRMGATHPYKERLTQEPPP